MNYQSAVPSIRTCSEKVPGVPGCASSARPPAAAFPVCSRGRWCCQAHRLTCAQPSHPPCARASPLAGRYEWRSPTSRASSGSLSFGSAIYQESRHLLRLPRPCHHPGAAIRPSRRCAVAAQVVLLRCAPKCVSIMQERMIARGAPAFRPLANGGGGGGPSSRRCTATRLELNWPGLAFPLHACRVLKRATLPVWPSQRRHCRQLACCCCWPHCWPPPRREGCRRRRATVAQAHRASASSAQVACGLASPLLTQPRRAR